MLDARHLLLLQIVDGVWRQVADVDGADLVADQVVVGGALDAAEDADRRLAQDAPALMIACGLALRSFD